ncbi:hypothetical protein AB5N19_02273 [Seiridium cardinale]
MVPNNQAWVQTAYVRTIHNSPDGNFWDFLYSNVHQWEKRHRYIFGADTITDETTLGFMLARTSPDSNWYDPRLERQDLFVYLSKDSSKTNIGRNLQRKLESAGISYICKDVTAKECDEAMLWESDYVLDQLT